MDAATVIREYLLLGLRFDRIEEGYVDSFTGDPALRRPSASEPAARPGRAGPRAPSGCWPTCRTPTASTPQRADYLAAHLRALACAGRKFAGEDVGFVEEVRDYFDVDIAKGDPDRYREAHRKLDEALGGSRPAGRAHAGLPHRRGDPAGAARGVHPRVLQRAARPGPRRLPAAGRRDDHLRDRHRQAVVGLQLLRGRLPLDGRGQRRPQAADVEPAAAGRPRVVSRVTTPSTAARRPGSSRAAGRPSRRSSWSTPRSA